MFKTEASPWGGLFLWPWCLIFITNVPFNIWLVVLYARYYSIIMNILLVPTLTKVPPDPRLSPRLTSPLYLDPLRDVSSNNCSWNCCPVSPQERMFKWRAELSLSAIKKWNLLWVQHDFRTCTILHRSLRSLPQRIGQKCITFIHKNFGHCWVFT